MTYHLKFKLLWMAAQNEGVTKTIASFYWDDSGTVFLGRLTIFIPISYLPTFSESNAWAYPPKLKMLNIIPIVKADDETDTSNYRPISLLSNVNRIFEKIMYGRMRDFIKKYSLLYSSRYGFRQAHSTQHAILDNRNYTNQHGQRTLFMWRFYCLKKSLWHRESYYFTW